MTNTIVALDLETTGLDSEQHHIWEIGLLVRGHRDPRYDGKWHMLMAPRLSAADPKALQVGRYYERAPQYLGTSVPAYLVCRPDPLIPGAPEIGPTGRLDVARAMAVILDGATLVGINPQFDAAFMSKFLRSHWQAPTWHHRLVDVVPLAAGYLAGARDGYNASIGWLRDWHDGHNAETGAACRVPAPDLDTTPTLRPVWSAEELSLQLDVAPPAAEDRHTALGDAAWALSIYDRVLDGVATPLTTPAVEEPR